MQRNQLEQLWGRASQWTGSKVKKRAVHNKRETDGTAWMRASESSVMGTEALTGNEWTEVKTGAICRHLTKLFLTGRLGPRNSSYVSPLYSSPTGKVNAEGPKGQSSMTAGQGACEKGDSHYSRDTLAIDSCWTQHIKHTLRYSHAEV